MHAFHFPANHVSVDCRVFYFTWGRISKEVRLCSTETESVACTSDNISLLYNQVIMSVCSIYIYIYVCICTCKYIYILK